jgi:hypothetical protein
MRTFYLLYTTILITVFLLRCWAALQRTNTENLKQIFPEKELRGHSPYFHIHVSVSDYIFSWSICLFCCRIYVDPSWEYISRSQTHECGNWDWGRAIPRKGMHKWDFRCSARFEPKAFLPLVGAMTAKLSSTPEVAPHPNHCCYSSPYISSHHPA